MEASEENSGAFFLTIKNADKTTASTISIAGSGALPSGRFPAD